MRSPNYVLRRQALLTLMLAMMVVTVAGAFYRQVVETDYLQSEGARRYLRESEIPARRGMILDRNGEPLAVSTPVTTLWADPTLLARHAEHIAALAAALDIEPARLRERLAENAGRRFMYLKRRVHPREADAVAALIDRVGLTGIGTETEYRRFYPGAEVFGHVVGFTNIDDHGQEGIERAFDRSLRAHPGLRRVIQDGLHNQVAELEQVRAPRDGADLALTLDRRLQFIAYRELKRAVEEHQAVGGSAVILDVASGEILAMVNQPGYNPNAVLGGDGDRRRNRALTDVFEPGSSMKPFVVALALENGLVGPNTPIDTRPGTLAIGRYRVRDVHDYGLLDTTGVITKSSNVGIVKLALRMDAATMWQFYGHLGFGTRTQCGFPGESGGVLPHHGQWSEFEQATLAFGYGLSTTTLQLARAYAVLAADGVRRPVTLLQGDARPRDGVRVFSATTARQVRAMMETVVSDQGTGRRAAIDGYRVAGKTGTAKKSAGREGYSAGRYQSVFAGMVPAGAPRFVMVVMVDEPHGKSYYGGLVAAPVFSRVMENALRLYNVPPDDPTHALLLAATAEGAP
nr:penicillin-binding protein 2 [Thiococcus pfennigii]